MFVLKRVPQLINTTNKCVTAGALPSKQYLCLSRNLRATSSKMTSNDPSTSNSIQEFFQGKEDRFRGITVESRREPCDAETFSKKLKASLDNWQEKKVRGVWFKVAIEQADWVPILAKNNFWFHHAKPEGVMMCRWLPDPKIEPANIPPYCHTMLSIGGLVMDSKGQMLVIKERFWTLPNWKVPGGYIDNKEDLAAAAEREVFEETGIQTRFVSIIGFMHAHTSQFGCSDIYFIAKMEPIDENQPIKKCEREISQCCWMKIEDYINSKEVHGIGKRLIRTFMDSKDKVFMPGQQVPHPLFPDKKVTIFYVSPDVPSPHL